MGIINKIDNVKIAMEEKAQKGWWKNYAEAFIDEDGTIKIARSE